MIIDTNSLMLIGIGVVVSIISYFLKNKMRRLRDLEERVHRLENDLTKNSCQDRERWYWISKNLEDRRQDVQKLFDLINNFKK